MAGRLRLAAALATTFIGLTAASSAGAAGYFGNITPRFGSSPIVHYRIPFTVYDGAGNCIPDEYGFYDNPACDDYDSNNATVVVRVYRILAHRLRFVTSDQAYGLRGLASEDLYDFQLHAPYYMPPGSSLRYRAKFLLIDPVTDRVVDRVARNFAVYYR